MNTGRSKGLHDIADYVIGEINDFVFNCHVCKRTFSPIKIKIEYLPDRFYRFGVWCRLAKIIELDRSKVCNCDPHAKYITLYDNVDPAVNSFGNEDDVEKYISK